MQRLLDIFFSGIAMVLLSPILVPIACMLKFSGEGEVIYKQSRVGINGSNFGLIKFATMLKDSPNIGSGEITIKNDPRVLPLGQFLRKSKINELPQLWNIFIGDMSIVGPRPMVPNTYARYPIEAQKLLNTVRPGLTGIGSIIFRDEEKLLDGRDDPVGFYNENITPHKSDLELWFIDNNTLWLYIKIIFVTAWVVVFPSSTIVDKAFDGIPSLPDSLI
jgi:lipopolysaccharide/colanic/teichoic acid biosynthesis glycosyltransferase